MDRYVHTRSGKAKVNWYRNSELGITYLDLGKDPMPCNVLPETEVEFRYGEIKPDEERPSVQHMPRQNLRAMLQELRESRNGFAKKKSKVKKTKSTRSKKEKPKMSPMKKLENLSPEEKEHVLKLLSDNS